MTKEDITREEAIEALYELAQGICLIETTPQGQAMRMAIEALKQEPNCPYYVIDDDGYGLCMNHNEQKYCQGCKHNGIKDNDICLECEYDGKGMTRYEPQEPCGDVISREAVLSLPRNRTYKLTGVCKNESIDVDLIEALPPVNPQNP